MSNQQPIRLFVPERFRQCHQRVARRMAWPYSFENDILIRWRANILASILMTGIVAGLFAFVVIAGVLMGNREALAAIIINAVTIGILGWLMTTGRWGQTFVLFSSTQAMIAAGVNFVCLNTLTAVGVATLVQEKIDLVLILLKKDLDGVDVRTEYAPDLPLLAADPGMIEHALVNLLQNAVHAVSLSPAPQITIRAGREKCWVVIEIQDNGCGIPPEYMDRVFEPAFTLKGSKDAGRAYEPGIKGTGYGMANVKRYIEQHRGTIDIQSVPEKGTTVRIGLPVSDTPEVSQETGESGMEIDPFVTGRQILVVEDEPAISQVLSRLLTHAPCRHTVDIAEDGKAALDCLVRKSYDLVSLDYLLPGRRNGMDIYRHIRKHRNTLPVLFMSGNIQFLESIRLLQENDPYLDHVSKPCQGEDYLSSVNRLLQNEKTRRQGTHG